MLKCTLTLTGTVIAQFVFTFSKQNLWTEKSVPKKTFDLTNAVDSHIELFSLIHTEI
jgi:hypothetical protein